MPGPAGDAREHLGGVGHLRHPFRADERRHLDHRQIRRAQAVDELDLVGRRDQRAFVLQPVARADFDDRDRSGDPHHDDLPRTRHESFTSELHAAPSSAAPARLRGSARRDDAVAGRAERQLHLHRFEDHQRLAFRDRVAGLHENLEHRRRHRRRQRAVAAMCRSRGPALAILSKVSAKDPAVPEGPAIVRRPGDVDDLGPAVDLDAVHAVADSRYGLTTDPISRACPGIRSTSGVAPLSPWAVATATNVGRDRVAVSVGERRAFAIEKASVDRAGARTADARESAAGTGCWCGCRGSESRAARR